MKYKNITGPALSNAKNFLIGGNYYFSIIIKNDITELCFPLMKNSSLICFKIKGLFNEGMFHERGWIRNYLVEKDFELIIPPYSYGFFLNKVDHPEIIGAYTKIFWEKEIELKSLRSNWSDFPIYYSMLGEIMPSIGIKDSDDGYYISIGDTPERALLNSIHLSRVGKNYLKLETEKFLKNFKVYEKKKIILDNIMLALFFSNGICIDTGDDCIMASKSPKYYVSCGYWARDFIFWTLPIIEKFDVERAKSLIKTVLDKYWRNKGTHALYIDGRILYEGFEFDQLSYHLLLLSDAISLGVIDEKYGINLAEEILSIAEKRRAKKFYLYSTELNSSDDPVTYDYVTFNNVIFWYSLKKFANFIRDAEKKLYLNNLCKRIRKDIIENMVKDGRFVYSTDLNGNYEFYDDPTGSIILFPFLGFVRKNSRIFKRSLEWIMSDDNPYFFKGKFNGEGNRHVPHPWLHYYSSLILSNIFDIDILNGMPLDDFIACETLDENTGECLTGIHFPGSSGFLVQSFFKNRGRYA